MQLVRPEVLGTGYEFYTSRPVYYTDNVYTSPTLFCDPLEKKIWACGTIRKNRVAFPKDRSGALDR